MSALPLLGGYVLLGAGIAMTLAPANVFFRDIGAATTLGLLFLFWATPIIYSLKEGANVVSDFLLRFNPLAWASKDLQGIFVQGKWAQIETTVVMLIVSFVVFMLGYLVFSRSAGLIADEL